MSPLGGGEKKMDSPHNGSPTGFHTLMALVHVPGDIPWEFAGLITCTYISGISFGLI